MSEIDSYKHECIGIVMCPSDHEIVPHNRSHRIIPLYVLHEDALTATSFCAKKGDLLLGGGSGESAALRISVPEVIVFYSQGREDALYSSNEPVKAYWSMNDAYVFCSGYARLGWTPSERIEDWLAQHVLAFVLAEYPNVFGQWKPSPPPRQDGSLCRVPTAEEKRM